MPSPSNPARTRLIVILILAFFVIVPIIIFAIIKAGEEKPLPITEVTDKDTGQVVTYDPNIQPERQASDISVITLGLEPLVKANLPDVQLTAVRELFDEFSKERLNSQFKTVTIRPGGLAITDDRISSTLRLGETDEALAFEFKMTPYKGGRGMYLVVKDPQNKHGGDYRSETKLLFVD